MIASLTADALQISAMVCQKARPTQRTVACSHLIEYAPKGARYAGSDASALCALRSCCVLGTGAFRERDGAGVSTLWSMAVLMRADGVPLSVAGAVVISGGITAGIIAVRSRALPTRCRGA